MGGIGHDSGRDGSEDGLGLASAWERLAAAVRDVTRILERPDTPLTPLDRAEAYRHFARLLTLGMQQYVHHADPDSPSLYRLGPETKFGGENPDVLYHFAPIDGVASYRITGERGTTCYIEFSVASGFPGVGGEHRVISRVTSDQLEIEDSGEFELVLSAKPVPGNWMSLESDATLLMTRQVFADWDREEAAKLRLLRIGREGSHTPPLSPDALRGGLEAVADFLPAQARVWAEFTQGVRDRQPPNALPAPELPPDGLLGSKSFFSIGHFSLAEDEVLIVEVPDPQSGYLGFQLTNFWWFESLEYTGRITSRNRQQAHISSDGLIRYVIAHRDPGVPNWLDTEEHAEGLMMLRWALVDSADAPRSRVVASERLRHELPADTPETTPAMRSDEIARRRAHVARRYYP